MATLTVTNLKSILSKDTAKIYSDFYLVAAGLTFKPAFNKGNPVPAFNVIGLSENVDFITFNGVVMFEKNSYGQYKFSDKELVGTVLDFQVEASEILTHFSMLALVAKSVKSQLGVNVSGSAWSLYFEFGNMGNSQHRFSNHITNSGSPAANRKIVMKNGAAFLELPSVFIKVA
jgi:hypothetical protein